MVELTLVFFLGALVAGLVWVLLLPAIWHRASRLTRQRLERALPLDTNEILAERDRERAEFAVKTLMLDRRMEAMQAQVLAAKSEVGDRLAVEAKLMADTRRLTAEVDARTAEAATAHAALALRDRQIETLEAALQQARSQLDALGQDHLALQTRLSDAQNALAHEQERKDALSARLSAAQAAAEEERARVNALRHELREQCHGVHDSEGLLRDAQ